MAIAEQNSKPRTIGELLISQKKQIEAALPKHLTAERMLRIVMTELRKNPKLKECDMMSLIGAVLQCSQLGLEPGGALGHSYLIPFRNNKKNIIECQFMVGYRGMIDLARRSGQVISISAHEVYSNDKFEYCYGIEEKCFHQPASGDRGEFIGAYAVVKLRDGGHQFEYLPKSEINKIRDRSKSKNEGPWITNYDEMAKKSVIRRLFKYLPISIELQRAVSLDEKADLGEQDNISILDGEFENVTPIEVKKTKTESVLEKLDPQNLEQSVPPNELDKSWEEYQKEEKA